MAILGGRTKLVGRLARTKANALVMELRGEDDAEVAVGRQKGGAGVLFGFKNGGKGAYTVTAGEDVLDLAVAGTTVVSRGQQTLGRIVPGDGHGCHLEDSAGTVVVRVHGHTGDKADAAWTHPLTDAAGAPLGSLTLVRRNEGFGDLYTWLVVSVWLQVNVNQKLPTAGVALDLTAPVADHVGDLLVAACMDAAVLGRGYLAQDVGAADVAH